MSNETKIGILTVVAITLLILGYKFIKGQNIFTTSNLIYVDYEQVDQLTASSPVFINGFQVGIVSKVYLLENMSTIQVVLNINNGIDIHKNAVAEIITSSIMGGKSIRIVENQPCNGENCAQTGDHLRGRSVGMLNSMVPQKDMQTYMTFVKENLGDVYDTLNAKLRHPDPNNTIGQSIRDLQGSLANLRSTTDQINSLMLASTGKINRTLGNFENISNTIAGNSQTIDSILQNAATFSSQLNDLDLKALMSLADSTMGNANGAVAQLEQTLKSADLAMASVQDLLLKVKNGDGTIGLLLNDDQLYHNLNSMSMQLDTFLTNFREKPYRYMPLKSRNKVRRYDRKDKKEESGN
jgi:ABC-type transport system involved in resistance to organic solvents, periplasmic component